MFKVVLSKRAAKNLEALSKKDQERVIATLENLEKDPYIGKKLQGPLTGLWSVRVWPLRIIYIIEKKVVTVSVLAIGERKDVYRKLKT